MANYTFEPRTEDGTPRKYVGIFRLPFEEFLAENQLHWPLWYHQDAARKAWTGGYGDRPLYEEE